MNILLEQKWNTSFFLFYALGVNYIQDYPEFTETSVFTEHVEFVFGIVIICLAIFGFVVNSCALVILHRKNSNTAFHQASFI